MDIKRVNTSDLEQHHIISASVTLSLLLFFTERLLIFLEHQALWNRTAWIQTPPPLSCEARAVCCSSLRPGFLVCEWK